jgi:hypothetical protein
MKKLIPFLSLGWGVVSVFLISRDDAGFGKLFLFSVLFALAAVAGLFLIAGKNRFLDWLRLASMQSALQYILFFAAPLLWKSQNWIWLAMAGLTGLTTLWDPAFNRLWQEKTYRLWTACISLVLLAGLALVAYAPQLFRFNFIIAAGICFTVFFISILLAQPSAPENESMQLSNQKHFRHLKSFTRGLWQPVLVFCAFLLSPTPIPPLGIWLNSAEIKIHPEDRSVSCETKIASPSGFTGKVIHVWEFSDPRIPREEIVLPEITGNGIEEKPFRTVSRKKSFGISFEEATASGIHCSVHVPFLGPVGKISSASPK